jgi:hypothetical protein
MGACRHHLCRLLRGIVYVTVHAVSMDYGPAQQRGVASHSWWFCWCAYIRVAN